MLWFWVGCAAAGVSLFLFAWRMGAVLVHCLRSWSIDEVVPMSASRRWRLAGPAMSWLGRHLVPWLSWRLRRRLENSLRQAGWGVPWTLDLIAGAMGLACLAGVVLALLLAIMLTPTGMPGWRTGLAVTAVGSMAGAAAVWRCLQQHAEARKQQMAREFPFLLDLITLCVEAGQNLHGALQQAASYGPDGPLRQELQLALQAIRTGKSRAQALDDMVNRCHLPVLAQWSDAIQQADRLGMNLGPLLRAQAAQQRTERFLRAETLAMQAPVKMLLPLVACLFPCTFLMLGFPIGTLLLQALQ